jgi:hypothetical protein
MVDHRPETEAGLGGPGTISEGANVMTLHPNQSCMTACAECAMECERCADACLDESNVSEMAACIRLDRDCAAICFAAVDFMSRNSTFAAEICRLCAEVCESCAAECARHEMDHCQRCAEACARCAEECRRMATASV